jgi:HEPN domain-containing protein
VLARMPLPAGAKYEQLLFHAQQAAEKALKAILILEGVDFPFTHNLQRLIE